MSSNNARSAVRDALAAPRMVTLLAMAAVEAVDFCGLVHEPQRRRRYPKKFHFQQRTSNLTELEFQNEFLAAAGHTE